MDETAMESDYPLAYRYFSQFKDELLDWSGYKKFLDGQPFYSLYNIGPYTLAPVKLCWKFMSKGFETFVVPNAEGVVPDLNVMFIPLDDLREAYYLSGLLNSRFARDKIEASSNWTFPSGVIKKVSLQKFDESNPQHLKIASLQKALVAGDQSVQEELLNAVFEYWFSGTGIVL